MGITGSPLVAHTKHAPFSPQTCPIGVLEQLVLAVADPARWGGAMEPMILANARREEMARGREQSYTAACRKQRMWISTAATTLLLCFPATQQTLLVSPKPGLPASCRSHAVLLTVTLSSPPQSHHRHPPMPRQSCRHSCQPPSLRCLTG
jgi:hypothetical protein